MQQSTQKRADTYSGSLGRHRVLSTPVCNGIFWFPLNTRHVWYQTHERTANGGIWHRPTIFWFRHLPISFGIYHRRECIRHLLPESTALTLACSLTNSRLDYCNALLYGAASTISKLQRVQNNAARLVLAASRRCDAKPLLRQLHWLPVRQRVLYKTEVTTRKVLTTGVPAYLKEHLVRHAATRQTRSTARPLLTVPRTNTMFARRSFSYTAPVTWNNLPADVLLCNSDSSS